MGGEKSNRSVGLQSAKHWVLLTATLGRNGEGVAWLIRAGVTLAVERVVEVVVELAPPSVGFLASVFLASAILVDSSTSDAEWTIFVFVFEAVSATVPELFPFMKCGRLNSAGWEECSLVLLDNWGNGLVSWEAMRTGNVEPDGIFAGAVSDKADSDDSRADGIGWARG